MLISKQSEYALKCIMYLSSMSEKVSGASKISEKESIPKPFLNKILQKLSKAGYVESSRGQKGGFRLAKKPDDIYILDIINVIEGSITINRCAFDEKYCKVNDSCNLYPIWIALRTVVENELGRINFRHLMEKSGGLYAQNLLTVSN